MASYRNMNTQQLNDQFDCVKQQYEKIKSTNLDLNMARGKPAPLQLDLSMSMLTDTSLISEFKSENGFDCRNYGLLDGIPEAKKLFAEIFSVDKDMVLVGGNSSLNMMFDVIAQGMTTGFSDEPWLLNKNRKFLCPCPGYDRHFAITEHFGFELIPIAMLEDGPDMDEVERFVKDPDVKGMWCVPKYSNPTGITFSDKVVERIAALKPAAKDFKVMWDNAYIVHDLNDTPDKLANIFDYCQKYNSMDMVIEFGSTSKVTFAGGGIAALAASKNNLEIIQSRMTIQTISADKINQLRHAKMFPDLKSLTAHMKKHADILAPKFEVVNSILERELDGLEILSWIKPNGGYFISVNTLPGCAKRVVELCKNAGVIYTSAGASFPNGNDPLDSNIRLAPSFPSLEELEKATELFTVCVKYATLEMLLA